MTEEETQLVLLGFALGLILGCAHGVSSTIVFIYVMGRRRSPSRSRNVAPFS